MIKVRRIPHPVSRNPKRGFTLIEVMVAATVLSLGTVLIHEIFFRSLELANYSYNYLNFAPWLDERLWQAQNSLSKLGKLDPKETKGKIRGQSKDCEWSVLYNLINSSLSQQLYKVDIVAFWQEGQKKVKFQRTAFAIYEKE